MKFLDCFCGMGGASEGFAREGFDCTGIDIVDVGYPYKLILKDMRELDGNDFKGYDIIWGSPPCRDFSPIARIYGKRWKHKPNPENGLELVNTFLGFVGDAQPSFWIMENVHNLTLHLPKRPKIETYLRYKKHAFWGNFPFFLMPKIVGKPITKGQLKNGLRYPQPRKRKRNTRIESAQHAKIPLPCSLAFAQACKEFLGSP